MLSKHLHPSHLGRILLILLISGCQETTDQSKKAAPPFVLKSLELSQKKANGELDWDLKSPMAYYHLSNKTVSARDPEGILYKSNKPSFEISANIATVINDGEIVILEGNVKLQQVTGEKVLITGDRLQWTPKDSIMSIDHNPQAFNKNTRIKSNKAEFHQSTHELIFTGPTQLDRWKKQRHENQNPTIVITGGNSTWNLDNGSFKAAGPIDGKRYVEAIENPHELTATRLEGNSKKGYLDLISPVVLMIPDKQAILEAKTTRWHFNNDMIISNRPFSAKQESSTYRGDAFRVDLDKQIVEITKNCKLSQPDEKLTANKCSLNWDTDEVLATGDVLLKRKANNQTTRSDQLDGRIGSEGTVVFSSPGSTVKSQLTIRENEDKNTSKARQSSPIEF